MQGESAGVRGPQITTKVIGAYINTTGFGKYGAGVPAALRSLADGAQSVCKGGSRFV